MSLLTPEAKCRPLRCEPKLTYARGTTIRAITEMDGQIEGVVNRNPMDTANSTFLELQRTKIFKTDGNGKVTEEYIGFYRLDASETHRIEIVATPEPSKKPMEKKNIKCVLITSKPRFFKLIDILAERKIVEVAMNFYGRFVGRDGDVGWVVLFFNDAVTFIDVLALEKVVPDFWSTLEVKLFSNIKIRKVVYNSRPIADYLFHQHAIIPKHMEDLQVMESYVWSLVQDPQDVAKTNWKNLQFKSLVEMIEHLLKGQVDAEVISYLKKKENKYASSLGMDREDSGPHVGSIKTKFQKYVKAEMSYLLAIRDRLLQISMDRLHDSMRTAMEQIINVSNAQMEKQLRNPLTMPSAVREKIIPPRQMVPIAPLDKSEKLPNGIIKGVQKPSSTHGIRPKT